MQKTAQDARHFLFWCFFGPVPTARLILPLKTGQDARRILFWRFLVLSLGPLIDRVAHLTPKTAQDARQFCVWRFLAPCRFQMDFSVPKCTHLEP